jgi:hypothetical protein
MNNSAVSELYRAWHSRAEECRAAAKRLHSPEARRRMLAAAEDFERLAIGAAPIAPLNDNDHWARMTP